MIGELPADEQRVIDEAVHDGDGWAIADGLSERCIEALSSKGIIRLWKGRWQLTPLGYGRTARSRAMTSSPLSDRTVAPSA